MDRDVEQANDDFYRALERMFAGDLGPMEEIWSHSSDVTNIGPLAGRQVGWEQVREEFERETHMRLAGHVQPREVLIRQANDFGYVVCIEHGENMTVDGRPAPVNHRATNIFRREAGRWRLVHHHTDLSESLLEAAIQAEQAAGHR